MVDREHVIVTGRHGQVDSASVEAAWSTIAGLGTSSDIVLHFHGGLVNEKAGIAKADRLAKVYTKAGATPLFIVWQSGLFEVIQHNLNEILREELFDKMLRHVLQFTVGKLRQGRGERAAGTLHPPTDMATASQLRLREANQEPFATEQADDELTEISESERGDLEHSIEADIDIIAAVESALIASHPARETIGERGLLVRRQGSTSTLMDPEALDEITPSAIAGERAVTSTALLARKCAAALVRVVRRFRLKSDHGVYTTVVEELLREFYLANAGGAIWKAMKEETSGTFEAGSTVRGGQMLLDGLYEALLSDHRPRITLVGHSAGSIYINHLLRAASRRERSGRPWPDTRFRVVFLAPACTYSSFAAALDEAKDLVGEFRLFTMDDQHERGDQLIGPLYPRSLLYLVNGVLERDDDDRSVQRPILGMARELDLEITDELRTGRAYLSTERIVLSPTAETAPQGRRANAKSHGAFDDDAQVLDSIQFMVGARQ